MHYYLEQIISKISNGKIISMKELFFARLKNENLFLLWRLLKLKERIPKVLYIVSWNRSSRVPTPCAPFYFNAPCQFTPLLNLSSLIFG